VLIFVPDRGVMPNDGGGGGVDAGVLLDGGSGNGISLDDRSGDSLSLASGSGVKGVWYGYVTPLEIPSILERTVRRGEVEP
jgi:hypothetical protein